MENEANQLVQKAKSKLNPGFLGKMFTSQSSRLEEALDLYEKAANIYKLNKKWYEAGECYENCAKILDQLGSDNSAGHYSDAVHCFNFVDKKKASDNLNKCLRVYEKKGRFQQAGKIQKQMAEELEADIKYGEAIAAYRKAAEYFSMENLNSRSYEQGCLLKVADLMCVSDHKDTLEEAQKVIMLNYPLIIY
jgi:alpha-soluble NSF attachment protein